MRVALLPTAAGATLLSLAVAITNFACSSSSPAAEEGADSGVTTVPQDSTSKPTEDQGSTPPPADTSDAAAGEAGPADAGAGGFGTTDGDGGTRCLATSIRESETNNDLASADQLEAKSQTFCGRITAGDVDFFTFIMPQPVGDFDFQFQIDSVTNQQAFKIEASADGEPFNFFGDYPFKPNKPYVFKISSKGSALEYRMKLVFNFQ